MFVWQIPESLETGGRRNAPWEIFKPTPKLWVWTAARLVPGRHRWGEVLPKEGAAASSSGHAAPVPGWGRGNAVLRRRMLMGRMQENMCWALPGSACPNPLPAPNPLGKPRLGHYGCHRTLVSRRVSGGKQRGPHCRRSGCEYQGKKKPTQAGSRMSDSWEKRAWIRDEQRKRGSSALRITGRGRNKVSFGQCFSRMWHEAQVKCIRQLPLVWSSGLVPYPTPSQKCISGGVGVSITAPSMCFLWRFLGENKSSLSQSPETPRCPGSCWVNTAPVWNQISPVWNSSEDN